MNRVNESTFNSPLFAEYRAIEFVARLIDQGRLPRGLGPNRHRRVNAHRIVLGDGEKAYSADTKLSTDYDFFRMLYASGREASRRFLDEHFDDIGIRSTFDRRAEARAEWA
jgi:NTE family protein